MVCQKETKHYLLVHCLRVDKFYGNLITLYLHEAFGLYACIAHRSTTGTAGRGNFSEPQNQPAASWLGWLAVLVNAFTGTTLMQRAIALLMFSHPGLRMPYQENLNSSTLVQTEMSTKE